MKKILLIEDDTVLRENTAELLELSNFEVITATNGHTGLIAAMNTLPDIIVCDIMMPKLDGYGVLEALSKNDDTKFIPFIFLSAKTERRDIRKGMDLGADDYITKPFGEEEIISALESRLAKAEILKNERNAESKNNLGPSHKKAKTLADLKYFFDDNGQTIFFKKGDIIYEEGNHSNYIYLIRKGVVKSHKFDNSGKELITALYKEDELFGYASFKQNSHYHESTMAIINTELVGITKQKLKILLENNHSISLKLFQLLADTLSGAQEQLLEMAYSSVNKKTATTILKFAKILNKKPYESIKISRNDLASVAGIATETLIRALSTFKKEGLIDIEGRNIKILDLRGLQNKY